MPRSRTPAADYKKILLRLPQEVLETCRKQAGENQRSVNAEIVYVLLRCYAKEAKPYAPAYASID